MSSFPKNTALNALPIYTGLEIAASLNMASNVLCTENLRSLRSRRLNSHWRYTVPSNMFVTNLGTNLVEETEFGSEASMSALMEMVDLHMLDSARGMQHFILPFVVVQ